MKTHELLELASLDALGLLDEHEREAFDVAFNAAPPAVQAQVRREQARISRADQFLPQVDPPVSLRAKVLAAVQQAMEAVTGSRRVGAAVPSLLPSRGVSPAWRGAAVACAAAAIVFGFAALSIYGDVKTINSLQESNRLADSGMQGGPSLLPNFFKPQLQRVAFAPVAEDAAIKSGAVVMIDAKNRTGYLYCKDLPKVTGEYSLVIVDGEGKVGKALITFESGAPMMEKTIPGLSLESGQNLAILSPNADPTKSKPILRTGASN